MFFLAPETKLVSCMYVSPPYGIYTRIRRTTTREAGASQQNIVFLKPPHITAISYQDGSQLVPHYAERLELLRRVLTKFGVWVSPADPLQGRVNASQRSTFVF